MLHLSTKDWAPRAIWSYHPGESQPCSKQNGKLKFTATRDTTNIVTPPYCSTIGTAHSAASVWSGTQVSCATKFVKIVYPIPDIAACCIAPSFGIVANFRYFDSIIRSLLEILRACRNLFDLEVALTIWVCFGKSGSDVLDRARHGDVGATGSGFDSPLGVDDLVWKWGIHGWPCQDLYCR